MFSILWIVALELVALSTYFYKETILVIGSQYINKQSEDLRHYS